MKNICLFYYVADAYIPVVSQQSVNYRLNPCEPVLDRIINVSIYDDKKSTMSLSLATRSSFVHIYDQLYLGPHLICPRGWQNDRRPTLLGHSHRVWAPYLNLSWLLQPILTRNPHRETTMRSCRPILTWNPHKVSRVIPFQYSVIAQFLLSQAPERSRRWYKRSVSVKVDTEGTSETNSEIEVINLFFISCFMGPLMCKNIIPV